MERTEILRAHIIAQNPTDEQRDAIFAEDLEFLLRAAPGSGKTWTSCRRFIWRGANWPYKVGGLALLSFTNAAIKEFHNATIEAGMRQLLSDPNYVGTFDAFVERFIFSPFAHLIAGSDKRPKLFIAPRPGDWSNSKLLVWMQLSGDKNIQLPAWEIVPYIEGENIKFRASSEYGEKELKLSTNAPIKEFLRLGFYTHRQRGYWACVLLLSRPHIAKVLARRFPEIIIDEAQDTNEWLLLLLVLLREAGSKITLIGDPDQCIYEFSMADPASLFRLKNQWKIPERPLSKSFRCSSHIANAVRNVGTNTAFSGRGDEGNPHRRAFIMREPTKVFSRSITEFEKTLALSEISLDSGAILCRGHAQLESIRGVSNYVSLKGQTQDLARAAFFRDFRHDYKLAFQVVEALIRKLSKKSDIWDRTDEDPDSEEARFIRVSIWRFVKSQSGLPPINLSASDWITALRKNLGELLIQIGVDENPKLGAQIKKTGLEDSQMGLPLFTPQSIFPTIRQETIHRVKGESIDGVLVVGSGKYFDSIVDAITNNKNTEDRRLAYVAMTRARNLLVVSLPAKHFDKHAEKWKGWGFGVI